MNQTATLSYKIKSILPTAAEWINLLSALYLVCTLLYPFAYQKPAYYAYFISLFADIIINRRWYNVKWYKAKWTFVAMILFYACIWIWHPFESSNLPHFKTVSELRLPFIAFGVLGLIFNINPKLKPQYFALPMIMTSLISIGYILFANMDITNNIPNSFEVYQADFIINRFKLLHTTHMDFNLYLNFSILFGIYTIYECRNIWVKILHLIGILMIYAVLLTSEGRVGFFTGNILIACIICYSIIKRNTKLAIPMIVIAIMTTFAIVSHHQRVKDITIEQDPRAAIWEHSIKQIKERPIFGYGVSDGRKIFVEKRTEDETFTTRYFNNLQNIHPGFSNFYIVHPHNVFLEAIIEFGITGLILIVLILTLPMVLTKGKRQIYASLLLFIIGTQAMFEVIGENLHPMFICWFLYIFLLTPMYENGEKQQTQIN